MPAWIDRGRRPPATAAGTVAQDLKAINAAGPDCLQASFDPMMAEFGWLDACLEQVGQLDAAKRRRLRQVLLD